MTARIRLLGPAGCLLALIFLSGCASRRALPAPSPATETSLETFVTGDPFPWTHFSAQGQLKMESSFFSGSGQYTLRMQRDSIVWMVIRYAGLEVARLQASRDSVILLNRWERTVDLYTWEDIRQQTGFPASLSSLQRLILGWLPLVPESWQSEQESGEFYRIKAKTGDLMIDAGIARPDLRLVSCRFWHTAQGVDIKGVQEAWSTLEGHPFSGTRYWEMTPEPGQRVFLQVLLQDASLSGPLTFPFQIPDRYERLD